MQQPKIAFCTTCKGRLPHLRETLAKNIVDNRSYKNAVFVVLDYNSNDGLAEHIEAKHQADIEAGNLALYRFKDSTKFHMAHAKNIAHRCGILEGADILVNVDADNFTGENFAGWIAEQFRYPNILIQAMTNRWVNIGGEDRWLSMAQNGNYEVPVPKGSSGRIGISANGFLKAGGYNEKFDSWGPDDKDFNVRLRRLGYGHQLIDRKFLSTILHNDRLRFREYPHARAIKCYEFIMRVRDSPETIVNYGRVGCGTVYKGSERIELLPIPTRIFGIGMHKTGTTSLHHALQILGYDSGHWTNAHWAKSICREMWKTGRSATLERCYALCDLPIPLFYRELDKAYPGSKFILTLRPEDDWLQSVKRHWTSNNKYHHQWDDDPFSHQVHEMLYGQSTFNEQVFRERFRRHNAEVMQYFRQRPEDLLVMNIGAGDEWGRLCRFLGNTVPSVGYPREMVTPSQEFTLDFQI